MQDWSGEVALAVLETLRLAEAASRPVAVCGIRHLPRQGVAQDFAEAVPVYDDQDTDLATLSGPAR